MSEIVTLTVPDDIVQRARGVAVQTNRQVEDVLTDWLNQAATNVAVEQLPDDQVLALRDIMMSDEHQETLRDLLARQREGSISQQEQARLDTLMASYRRGMVQKAQALQVAVKRGLQPPFCHSEPFDCAQGMLRVAK